MISKPDDSFGSGQPSSQEHHDGLTPDLEALMFQWWSVSGEGQNFLDLLT